MPLRPSSANFPREEFSPDFAIGYTLSSAIKFTFRILRILPCVHVCGTYRRYQLDIMYLVIRLWGALGIVYDIREPDPKVGQHFRLESFSVPCIVAHASSAANHTKRQNAEDCSNTICLTVLPTDSIPTSYHLYADDMYADDPIGRFITRRLLVC